MFLYLQKHLSKIKLNNKEKTERQFCVLKCWSYIDTLVSGSPILQNGKVIGAVTHVLVDNLEKGYGIFAENMLETAQSVAEQNLKEAS